MIVMNTLIHFVLAGSLLALLPGCERTTRSGDALPPQLIAVAAPMQAERPDTTGASVWAHLQEVGYQEHWTLWPGKGELYTGREPHGMLLTTYLNDAALEAVSTHAGTMPDGAIIVKENYKPDSTLAAITVMYKVRGYNPEHADWFFTKHLPDGSLAQMPNGMAMEGRLGGCQGCHGSVATNDYLFTGSLNE